MFSYLLGLGASGQIIVDCHYAFMSRGFQLCFIFVKGERVNFYFILVCSSLGVFYGVSCTLFSLLAGRVSDMFDMCVSVIVGVVSTYLLLFVCFNNSRVTSSN